MDQLDTIQQECVVFDECLVYFEIHDSLLTPLPVATATRTFVTSTSGKPIIINPQPILDSGFIWQFVALLLATFIYAYFKVSRRNFFKNIKDAFSSRPLFKQILRDDQLFPLGSKVPLFIAFTLTFTVFMLQVDEMLVSFRHFPKTEELQMLTLYLAGIIAFLLVKTLLHLVVGLLFNTQTITREYISNSFYFNTVSAIVFIPLLMISTFSKSEPVIIAIIVIGLIMIALRAFRGIIILLDIEMYSYFQKFLYFCTLEILPFLAIYKMIATGII